MTDKTRIKIAGIVTALFLAGVSTVGLASHRATATAGTTAPVAAAVQQPTTAPAAQASGRAQQEDYENTPYEERD